MWSWSTDRLDDKTAVCIKKGTPGFLFFCLFPDTTHCPARENRGDGWIFPARVARVISVVSGGLRLSFPGLRPVAPILTAPAIRDQIKVKQAAAQHGMQGFPQHTPLQATMIGCVDG